MLQSCNLCRLIAFCRAYRLLVSEAGLKEDPGKYSVHVLCNLRRHFAAPLFLNTFHLLGIVVILQTWNSELEIYVVVVYEIQSSLACHIFQISVVYLKWKQHSTQSTHRLTHSVLDHAVSAVIHDFHVEVRSPWKKTTHTKRYQTYIFIDVNSLVCHQ